MAFSRFDTFARSVVGPSAAGAQVFLCLQPAVTTSIPPSPLAQLYSDPLGANPISQPLVCDGFGHASCYVASGTFTEVVVYGGMLVQVYPDQFIASTIAVQVNGLEVNGNPVTGPNFNGSVPAAPTGSTNVTFQFDGLGNVSASLLTSIYAPLASPALTGTPTAPTQASSDDSTAIATTAYVQSVLIASGAVTSVFGRTGAVVAQAGDYTVAQITGAAPLSSPMLTGVPTAPTPLTSDNSTTLATTAYVKAQGIGAGTVTNFSASNIGSIATASVTNPTSTPALTFTLDVQPVNTVWAGPSSGVSAVPTFRNLVTADIPSNLAVNSLLTNGTSAPSPNPAISVFNITASSANGASPSVVTVTATNTFVAGQVVVIAGTGESSINGNTYAVLSTGLSNSQFQFNGPNGLSYTNSSDTGTATLYLAPKGSTPFWYTQDSVGNWFPQAAVEYTTPNGSVWVANTSEIFNFYIVDSKGYVQGVTTGGTTGSTQPAWNETVGGTTTDNTVTWTNFGWVGNPGVVTLCRRFFVRDSGVTTQYGKNAMVGLVHLAGVGTSKDNQDRALWVNMSNPVGDTSNIYGMEGLQIELDINGSPNFIDAIDGEVAALSLQLADSHIGAITAPAGGVHGLRCSYFREAGAGTWGSEDPTCGEFQFINSSTVSNNSGNFVGISTECFDGTNTTVNAVGIGLNVLAPVHRFTSNLGINIGNYGTNVLDFSIRSIGTGQVFIAGPVGVPSLYPTGTTGNIPVSGSMSTQGFLVNNVVAPENPNVVPIGVTGSTPYTYVAVAIDVNGNSVTGQSQAIATGNATLSVSNYNLVQLSSPLPLGAVSYNIYRTVGGATQGLIGNITPNTANYSSSGSISISDTGLVADGTTPPSINSTGSIVAQGSIMVGYGGLVSSISNIIETSASVVTLTVPNALTSGQYVALQGLTTGTWLNGHTVLLTGTTATTLVFTDPTSHGVQSSHSETGTANPVTRGGYGVLLLATSAVTGAVPVKVDTSNANQVIETTTSDTGAGIVIGVCINSPAAGGLAQVITTGVVPMTLGTGTASIGNWVIVDTTTNGRVKCTGSYPLTAGTIIGVALSAQPTVGGIFNVMVGLR